MKSIKAKGRTMRKAKRIMKLSTAIIFCSFQHFIDAISDLSFAPIVQKMCMGSKFGKTPILFVKNPS
jgi:hypothetical protein